MLRRWLAWLAWRETTVLWLLLVAACLNLAFLAHWRRQQQQQQQQPFEPADVLAGSQAASEPQAKDQLGRSHQQLLQPPPPLEVEVWGACRMAPDDAELRRCLHAAAAEAALSSTQPPTSIHRQGGDCRLLLGPHF